MLWIRKVFMACYEWRLDKLNADNSKMIEMVVRGGMIRQ